MNYYNIFEKYFFGNRIIDYLLFICILLVCFIAIRILKKIIFKYLRKLTEKTETKFDDFLLKKAEKTFFPLLYLASFYIASKNLTLQKGIAQAIEVGGIIILTIVSIKFIIDILNYTVENYSKTKDFQKNVSAKGILVLIKITVWGFGITFLLDNLGFQISSVITGLGIGGVAVALAAQTLLKDLFSYFSIFFDRPFEIGDFIIVDDFKGTIEYIGIKSTKVRSLHGEQLIFSNSYLTDRPTQNYKRMEKRRILFKIGVVYSTAAAKLKLASQIITNAIVKINDAQLDRVHFSSFDDSCLTFETVYFVLSGDYNRYMDIQQQINYEIKEEFEKAEIEFAYPTQTIYISKP